MMAGVEKHHSSIEEESPVTAVSSHHQSLYAIPGTGALSGPPITPPAHTVCIPARAEWGGERRRFGRHGLALGTLCVSSRQSSHRDRPGAR